MADAPQPDSDLETISSRKAGLSTMWQGALFAVAGIIGLWISFLAADNARAILGAGPLIGGGMVGYGATQTILGSRLRFVRWIVAVISSAVVLGATIVMLEFTLGVTFA